MTNRITADNHHIISDRFTYGGIHIFDYLRRCPRFVTEYNIVREILSSHISVFAKNIKRGEVVFQQAEAPRLKGLYILLNNFKYLRYRRVKHRSDSFFFHNPIFREMFHRIQRSEPYARNNVYFFISSASFFISPNFLFGYCHGPPLKFFHSHRHHGTRFPTRRLQPCRVCFPVPARTPQFSSHGG